MSQCYVGDGGAENAGVENAGVDSRGGKCRSVSKEKYTKRLEQSMLVYCDKKTQKQS